MTLDERIEAAARALVFDDGIGPMEDLLDETQDEYRGTAVIALQAAFPELFTTPSSAWLAPWEAPRMFRDYFGGSDVEQEDAATSWQEIRAACDDDSSTAHLNKPETA